MGAKKLEGLRPILILTSRLGFTLGVGLGPFAPGDLLASTDEISSRIVLPHGVYSGDVHAGQISELGNHYSATGALQSLSRLNQTFTASQIAAASSEGKQLVEILNKNMFSNYKYGNNLNLGNLEFQGHPVMTYQGFALAKGISPAWSLGIVLPVIKYTSDVQVSQTGENNAMAIKEQVLGEHGGGADQLKNAFEKLSRINLAQQFNQSLSDKGYSPLQSQTKTFVGDVQVVSLYEFYKKTRLSFYNETTLSLPTGPSPNPDDLTDPGVFGQTSLKCNVMSDLKLSSLFRLSGGVGYTWRIADQVEKRVPSFESEVLPSSDRKERLNRDLGDSTSLFFGAIYSPTEYLNLRGLYEYAVKTRDNYSGHRGYDYEVLSKDTSSQFHKITGTLVFSSVPWFQKKLWSLPLDVAYIYSDIVAGTNVFRQLSHEMYLRLYFK